MPIPGLFGFAVGPLNRSSLTSCEVAIWASQSRHLFPYMCSVCLNAASPSVSVIHVRSVLLTPPEGGQNTCSTQSATIPKHQTTRHFWAFFFVPPFSAKPLKIIVGTQNVKKDFTFHIDCGIQLTHYYKYVFKR